MKNETQKESIGELIISLEKQALEIWNNGNPDAYLALSDADVIYFDPMLERKMEGLDRLTAYYEQARGMVHVDRYEMICPVVQATENMAVLTFNLNSYEGDKAYKWNCTEVYRRNSANEWKIIQTHWSLVRPLGDSM